MEVTVHGKMGARGRARHRRRRAAGGDEDPERAVRPEHAATSRCTSQVPGITHPYLNVGRIEGGTNTNVVPGKVVLKLDRRMIPEENPAEVEADAAPRDRRRRGRQPRHPRRHQAHAAGPRAEAAARQPPLVDALCRARPARSSASRSPRRARRCTPTCGCTASTASRRRSTAPGRARCSKAMPSAPTSTSCSKTCGAPPRWWHAPCSTCCS